MAKRELYAPSLKAIIVLHSEMLNHGLTNVIRQNEVLEVVGQFELLDEAAHQSTCSVGVGLVLFAHLTGGQVDAIVDLLRDDLKY